MDINQYILLFLKEKKEEMEEFKDYVSTFTFPKREISQDKWKSIYLNWVIKQENNIEKAGKIPKIYLSED